MIGGGYIGLELGTVWRRLGAKVTVVEFLDRITPGMDLEVSRQFQRLLSRQGLGFKLGTKVTAVDASSERLLVTTEAAEGGETEKMKADVVLVAIGRRPYTEGLGLETVDLTTDNQGRIEVDRRFATARPGHLRDRRRDQGADAGAQGGGRGRVRRRAPRRAAAAHRLRRDSGGHLHRARGRLGRQDRGAAEGGGRRATAPASSRSRRTRGRARPARPTASSRSWPTPPPTACSACTSSAPMPAR